jgi:glyoxylase-like metal-dependent hydrolase (beta-lactamase superfamily II)
MNRRSLLILILLIGHTFLVYGQRGQSDVSLEKLSDRLYLIKGGRGADGGLYIGDKGLLVIDAKMTKEAVDQTLSAIRGISSLPIKYLINTHSDGDHINGNQYFPEDVTFIAHENCRKEFFHKTWNGEQSRWHNPDLAPFIPAITFSDRMTVHLGEKAVELWYFGVGHTTGDAVVYFPDEKIAFLGDMIFKDRPQLIHAYKGGNSFEYIKTQKKMLKTLDADLFCSGHAEPVRRQVIEEHIKNMEIMQEKIARMMKKKMPLEKIQALFEENASRLVGVIFNEIEKTK